MKEIEKPAKRPSEELMGSAGSGAWHPWIPVLLCSALIFATIPLARGIQRYVYYTIGRDVFTNAVLLVIIATSGVLLFCFFFRLRVRRSSQYVWIFVCTGLYIYRTFTLHEHPEEAVHFLEYGILTYFVFRALRSSIGDFTIYLSTFFLVSLIGTLDEFLQWMMPERFWDIRDVGLNAFAGAVFLLGIGKGLRPEMKEKKPGKYAAIMLASTVSVSLLIIGLCLSNTPEVVTRYTTAFDSLSWLREEEPMTEYGYVHTVGKAGRFYSRFRSDELRTVDRMMGRRYGERLKRDIAEGAERDDWIMASSAYRDVLLHEFILHLSEREDHLVTARTDDGTPDPQDAVIALWEDLILQSYYGNTLSHAGLLLSSEVFEDLEERFPGWHEYYKSSVDTALITSFGPWTARIVIAASLCLVWITYGWWKKKLNH